MPRSMRAPTLETRSRRLKLAIAKKPYWARIGHGISLGYRRNQGPGTWSVRVANGQRGHWIKVVGAADDFDAANGATILDFWAAQDAARKLGLATRRGGDNSANSAPLRTLSVLTEADLLARSGDAGNVSRIRLHLPPSLAAKTVATLAVRDFKAWRGT